MKTLLGLAFLLCASLPSIAQSDDPLENPSPFESSSLVCEDPCPWDFDGNGLIDINYDLLHFLGNWNIYTFAGCQEGDFDEDNVIDIQDFREILPKFGTPCD